MDASEDLCGSSQQKPKKRTSQDIKALREQSQGFRWSTYRDSFRYLLDSYWDVPCPACESKAFLRVDRIQEEVIEQLLIVKRLSLLGVKFHFVGDLNQSIYEFRKSNPANVRKVAGGPARTAGDESRPLLPYGY